MSRLAAIAATALIVSLAPFASGDIVSHTVKTKLKNYEQLTLFLMMPQGGRADGVLCLSLLALPLLHSCQISLAYSRRGF